MRRPRHCDVMPKPRLKDLPAPGVAPPAPRNRAERRREMQAINAFRRRIRRSVLRALHPPEPFVWIERLAARKHLAQLMEERELIQRHLGRDPVAA